MMKTLVLFTVLIEMLVFVAITNARPNTSKFGPTFDEDGEAEIGLAEKHIGRGRRTRHSRQIYNEEATLFLKEILFEVKKISKNLDKLWSRPPATLPIPYPYPWPVLPMNCKNNFTSFDNRFGDSQVWPSVDDDNKDTSDDDDDSEDDDGSRPISFKPSPVKVPSPQVEHGSVQAERTTPRPSPEPTMCEAAVIYCCRYEEPQRKECFESLQCPKTYETKAACLPETINYVIQKFIDAYVQS